MAGGRSVGLGIVATVGMVTIGLARGQDAAPGRVVRGWPGASHVRVVLWIPGGYATDSDDRRGRAAALAEGVRLWAESELEPELRPDVAVTDDAWIVAVTAERSRASAAVAALGRVVRTAAIGLDGDRFLRARARARLAADDARFVYPGPMHAGRARAALWAESPLAVAGLGEPATIAALTADELRTAHTEWFRADRAVVVAVGAAADLDLATTFGARSPGADPVAPVARPLAPSAAAAERVIELENQLADGPFVSAAFRVTPWNRALTDDVVLPTLVALVIARNRIARARWDHRGNESGARFPAFAFDPLEPTGFIAVQRRGRNGGDPAEPRREIEALLRELRTRAPTDAIVRRAAAQLAREVAVGPRPGGIRTSDGGGRLLARPGRALAARTAWGWPEDVESRITSVDSAAVVSALSTVFASGGEIWVVTRPRRASR